MSELLVKLFQTMPTISVALLFGSCATGKEKFDSDLDIAVLSDKDLTSDFKKRLIEELALATGRSIDLIDIRTVGQPILGQILRNPVRLKGSDQEIASLFIRNVVEVADFMPFINRTLRERQQAWMK
jgi:uncharacterized protein